ncbi:MAG: hypothetical protein KBF21_20790 [Thermoanaerobaculia bacterium]|nr:hypothetical protein [Thermoanaerobaculia bacterium]MBP9826678.1 hypothetical protein [Thermoanaerobaculia bacterium]
MRRSRLTPIACRSLALALVCSPLPPLAAQVPTSPPPFVETIEVREVEVLVDISALPTFESIGRKAREDFIVIEEGVAHPLTELGSSDGAPWIFVLYFDSILAGPEARQRAAIELAGLSDRLTAGGLAEIVIADPLPRTLLSTASADALRRQLDELALAAGKEVERTEPSLATATAARLAQLDRLTVEIAARGGGGARALLLPVGAWPFDPESLARLTQAKPDASLEASEFQPVRETSRALAAYGWVTLPIALRTPRDVPEPSAAERRTQVSMGGSGDRRTTVPIVSISGQGEPSDPATAARVDTLTDFGLMPFAELARASSGALIGESGRLESTLGDLQRRRQFTYRSPFPQPGSLLALEVRWKGGDGRTLPAPRWLRSSTPPEVSAARLRRLLAGDAVPQAPKTAGIQWNPDAKRVCFPGDGDKRWIRLSTASEKDGQIQLVTGQPLQIERGADGLCADAPAVAPVGPRTASLIEELESESWTGAVTAPN